MDKNKRILIVTVNWLGDVLFSTVFIRAVRNNFPEAFIACMTVPRCKDILEANPYLDKIIIYDEDTGAETDLPGKIRFISRIKKYHFDTAFLLHRSFTRAFLMYLAGIGNRIGYYTPKRAFLLTEKPRPEKKILHRAKYYLGLIETTGLKTDEKGCDFFLKTQEMKWADDFLETIRTEKGQKIIIFNPGGNWLPKRWPPDNFIGLGRKLSAYFSGKIKILLSGSAEDAGLAAGIAGAIGPDVTVICGRATLRQTAALFKRSDLVISNDSGPLHIAVAVGANVIGLFGPTSPRITGPYRADKDKVSVLYKDIDCAVPCYNSKCADFKCMAAITPDEVFSEALIYLEARSKK